MRTGQIEPIYWLARNWLSRGHPEYALPLFEMCARKQKPVLSMHVEEALYDFEAWLYVAVCLHQLGHEGQAAALLESMHAEGVLPPGKLEEVGFAAVDAPAAMVSA